MLLAVDAGNTNVVFALFEGRLLPALFFALRATLFKRFWRVRR